MKAIQEEDQLLIFKVGNVMCCASARDVDSVVTAQPLHHVPHQSDTIAGVFQYRNETVSVVNVFKKFELQTPDDPEHGLFIMAYTHHGVVGYWIEAVIEITSDYGAHWSAPPIFVDGNIFDKTLIWNEQLVLHTDFDKLFAMHDSAPLQQWISEQGLVEESPEAEVTESFVGEELFDSSVLSVPSADSTSVAEESVDVEPMTTLDSMPASGETLSEIAALDDLSDLTSLEEGSDFTAESALQQHSLSHAEEESADVEPMTTLDSMPAPGESLSEIAALDDLSDLTSLQVEESDFAAESDLQQSSLFHVEDEISIDKTVTSVSSAHQPVDSEIKAEKNASNSREKPKISASVSDIAEAAKAKKATQNRYNKSVEFSKNANTQKVYDAIKLYMQPTSAQLRWSNDPYSVDRRQHATATAVDIEKLFEEKIADKVREYFDSLEAAKQTVAPAEPEPDMPLFEMVTDNVVSISKEYDYSAFQIDEEDSEEKRRKKEESIVKVIDRIQKNKPQAKSTDKLRTIASVLFIASLIFLLQHFGLLPNTGDSDIVELQLLNETGEKVEYEQNKSDKIENLTFIPPAKEKTPESNIALGAIALRENNMSDLPPAPVVHWNKHTVVKGDTLWHLADNYLSDPFRYPDLAKWNQIKNPDLIYPGDEVSYKQE